MEETWTPETDLELFFANYDVRITGIEKAAGLNPWIPLTPSKAPAGFAVTGIYGVSYPEAIREGFTLHQENPQSELLDFVVELSDGQRLHYISVSFVPDFHKERLLGKGTTYRGLHTIELVAKGPLLSIYSGANSFQKTIS